MKRTDGDSWDIVSSVGRTALGVATFRALESDRPQALIEDEFARWFVEAAGESHFTGLLADPSPLEGSPFFFPGFMGVRTKFFDDFFLSAAAAGVPQAVIVAAGLDARAYRLDWPAGTTVFEVDQPKVLDFKAGVLTEHGAHAKADRRPVAADLREDWPSALTAAGFDPGAPSAWSAEGLLPYLPGAAHDALFERIDGLAASGSRLAVDGFGSGVDVRRFAAMREKYFPGNPFGDMNIVDLFYEDDRTDPVLWLTEHDWSVERFTLFELAADYGLQVPELPDDLADLSKQSAYFTAVK
ncbi:class I SAM-dependent methyltransferase [Rhodococcus spelaei]|uniref:S-adenosyl-L-methionine-dependent methyltransferase n=1 Tax=Rhodococcus spelaei TaxID=2546320 RepID=A0A541B2D8_9NOCA|nr:class I SAM-dependent methyltransferase [Rhodococcus spelaei]TQF66486.1 class I SAM-dependent methyltransferase [Rhodococcus spelaei]